MRNSASLGFRSEKALIAWIDILGASHLSNGELEMFSSLLSQTTAFSSGVSSPIQLSDENRVNAILIGDAVCITQSYESQPNRNFVATTALNISSTLFTLGLPHRGVLVEGAVRCSPANPDYLGGRYITGTGVIRAYQIERDQKIVGMLVAEELLAEAAHWAPPWGGAPFQLLRNESVQHFLTSPEHLKLWSDLAERKSPEHQYSRDAKAMLDAHKLAKGEH